MQIGSKLKRPGQPHGQTPVIAESFYPQAVEKNVMLIKNNDIVLSLKQLYLREFLIKMEQSGVYLSLPVHSEELHSP